MRGIGIHIRYYNHPDNRILGIAEMNNQEFFNSLTFTQQMIVLECAFQSLRDELSDGFMREYGLLDLDMPDETLQPIFNKLDNFLNKI